MRTRVLPTLAIVLAMTCLAVGFENGKVVLREDLSGYHRAVTTKSDEAQKYFDQGLALTYGFNHDAAIATFQKAVSLDPNCAMAYWGIAIASGPNYNNPHMTPETAQAAYEAVQKAKELSGKVTPVERDLILALTTRYAWPLPEDRKALDVGFADAMREVWKKYPNDPDVGALFADAMMNLRPWDLWTKSGLPQPGTAETMATLERVLTLDPNHPGGCHYYIHVVEASPFPELALPAADRLRNRIPGAGHLVHMPTHIDIRVGRYADAIKSNQQAADVDRKIWASQGGIYTMYKAHNYHFVAYAAMFDGQRQVALTAARDLVKNIPLETVRALPDFLDAFFGVPSHVMVRFGMWNEMLKEPSPPSDLVASVAAWRYGRTVALAALGRVKDAEKEFEELKKAYAAVPESRRVHNNPAKTTLDIGLLIAEGELEYRRGNPDRAFELLQEAVARDDALIYDEPWGWMMPARHAYGALLLEQGRLSAAETVYREDLRQHPGNGWALKGLVECLKKTDRHEEAEVAEAQFRKAWERSDIRIAASCYCRTGQMAAKSVGRLTDGPSASRRK